MKNVTVNRGNEDSYKCKQKPVKKTRESDVRPCKFEL